MFTARPKTLFRVGSPKFRRMPKRKTVQKLKITWRLCSTRKPFRELCPRMRTPERGQLEAVLNLMPKAAARIQQAAQTRLHLSSVDLLYQSECDCARGE